MQLSKNRELVTTAHVLQSIYSMQNNVKDMAYHGKKTNICSKCILLWFCVAIIGHKMAHEISEHSDLTKLKVKVLLYNFSARLHTDFLKETFPALHQ